MQDKSKYPDVTQFSDLDQKLKTAEAMCRANNHSAEILYKQTGQVLPMFDEYVAKASVTKAHNKFYGLQNKYATA